jgi:hypothetical protein
MADTPTSEPGRDAPETLIAQAARVDRVPDSVNFDRINNYRRMYLEDQATRYINAADTDPSTRERSLDYNSFAGILNHLSGRPDLNDLEKAFVWSTVADRKGDAGGLTARGFSGGAYTISLDGSKDEIRDSHPTRAWNTPNHSVVSFADGYHGFGFDNGRPGLAYETREEANRRINAHESIGPVNVNGGDTQASMRLVAAFRQYRTSDWGDKFEAFANEWQIQMLETRGRDAQNIDQRFRDFGGRAEPAWLRDMRQGRDGLAMENPGLNEGARTVLASASAGLQAMPGREQLALNSPESAERLEKLLAADMNRRNVPDATQVFTNNDRSMVFAAAADPQLPGTQIARASVQDANERSTQDVVADFNRSVAERENLNNLNNKVASNTVDTTQAAPSVGARVSV